MHVWRSRMLVIRRLPALCLHFRSTVACWLHRRAEREGVEAEAKMVLADWLRFVHVEQGDTDDVVAEAQYNEIVMRRRLDGAKTSEIAKLPARAKWGQAVLARRKLKSTSEAGGEGITCLEFQQLLLSPANSAVCPVRSGLAEGELDRPMGEYWVATSHNTYAEADQLAGTSSDAMYRRLLLAGCRCIEIDCWDGENNEPDVTHGRTLCTRVRLALVLKAVGETAFVNSALPVCISLEVHCSLPQQKRIAQLLEEHLGDMLLRASEIPFPPDVSFSPAQLQRRFLIKGKVEPLAHETPSKPVRRRSLASFGGIANPSSDGASEAAAPAAASTEAMRRATKQAEKREEELAAQQAEEDAYEDEEGYELYESRLQSSLRAPPALANSPLAALPRSSPKSSPRRRAAWHGSVAVACARPSGAAAGASSGGASRAVRDRPQEAAFGATLFATRIPSNPRREKPGTLSKLLPRRSLGRSSRGSSREALPTSAPSKPAEELGSAYEHPPSLTQMGSSSRNSRSCFARTEGTTELAKPAKPKGRPVDPSLVPLITLRSSSVEKFLSLATVAWPHPITSIEERKLESFANDATALHGIQAITSRRLCRAFPRGSRADSSNMDPLAAWRTGASMIALNLQTNDLPTQLHHALFALGGGLGYVLKPAEMREAPARWPPPRQHLTRVSVRLVSLHLLPTRMENRPRLHAGAHTACHEHVPHLSSRTPQPTKAGTVSSPSIQLELHPIGGYCCISSELPPPEHAGRKFETGEVFGNGLNPQFDRVAHCLALEPRETILR